MDLNRVEAEREYSHEQMARVAAALYRAEQLNTDPPFEEASAAMQDHYAKLAHIAISSLRK